MEKQEIKNIRINSYLLKRNNIGHYIGLCVMILLFIFNVCASIYFINPKTTEDIFEENILKVVEVKSKVSEDSWGYATGLFIDGNGTILTNKHVVLNTNNNVLYEEFWIRTATSEEWVSAHVESVSESYDLATLKCNLKSNYYELDTNVNNGETVYTIGNPNGFGLSFSAGVVSSRARNVIYNGQTILTIQTSLVINEGNSGGPVFNANGKLLGIISFRLKDNLGNVIQGASFAIPSSIIIEFLKNK